MRHIFPGATLLQTAGYFPRSAPRSDLAWSVIHTTATLASAEALARRHSTAAGVTATFWVDRDGGVWQSLADPLTMAPWTNGVVESPDLSNPRIAACIAAGVNPNIRSLVTIENVSNESVGAPITAEQEAVNGRIIRWAHELAEVPISRETVIGHYQIASVNRPNCPARDKAVIDRIVALAQGGNDVQLKGVPIDPLNNQWTTITHPGGLGLTEDPTAQPYRNLLILVHGTAFTVDWIVQGNALLGSDRWYGGWVLSNPPQFGYLPAGGCGPLEAIVAGGDADTAYNEGLAAAQAAVEALPNR